MTAIVEAVPNFSEGRDAQVVRSIAAAMDPCVLDFSLDPDHHRSVITIAGAPSAVVAAAVRGAEAAARLIDLSNHVGVHPRVGAIDVLPFVPVTGVTLEECVSLAEWAGQEIWNRCAIPVYFYEAAARTPERRKLADVRREIRLSADAKPDIGRAGLHPTAGAAVVGARFFLIAYNVNLATADVGVAKAIAGRVRKLPGVRALGLWLESAGAAQVSMNLVDYRLTGIAAAFAAVRAEAQALGTDVVESELIGLAPAAALDRAIAAEVLLRDFHEGMILEEKLKAAGSSL